MILEGTELTRRIIRLRDKWPGSAMQLTASIEDEFVRRHASIAHSARHIVGGAGDDEIAKEGLTLPESTVELREGIQLVEAVEERLLGVGEQLLQIGRGALLRQLALVAEDVAFVAVAVDEEGHFGEVPLFPFVAWEVADDVAVD